jgi:hypothetical protein
MAAPDTNILVYAEDVTGLPRVGSLGAAMPEMYAAGGIRI